MPTTPTTLSRYTALTGPTELRNDPYHASQRGLSAGLLADLPGSVPDLINLGSDYFYSGLNSLLDVGDLSPYNVPRSLGIDPSQRSPIGPTSGQIEERLVREGLLAPSTETTGETLSRVGAGFAEGVGPAVAGAVLPLHRRSPAFFSGLLRAAKNLPEKGTKQQMTAGLLKGGAKQAEIEAVGLDRLLAKPEPTDADGVPLGKDVVSRDHLVDFIEDNEVMLEEVQLGQGQTRFAEHVEAGGERYKELILKLMPRRRREPLINQQLNLSQEDHHWRTEIENPVVHVRFNERTNQAGDDILFMEEVQSDWANAGLKKGFGKKSRELIMEEAREKFMRGVSRIGSKQFQGHSMPLRERIAWAEGIWDEYSKGLRKIPRNPRFEHDYSQMPELTRNRTVVDQLLGLGGEDKPHEILDYLETGYEWPRLKEQLSGVPEAPFVQNPNQWSRLALGRMLRYAADKGFDKLAWTTGQTQASRWGELQHANSLAFVKKEGKYEITLSQDDGMFTDVNAPDGPAALETKLMSEDEISKRFGSEMLERIKRHEASAIREAAYDVATGNVGYEEGFTSISFDVDPRGQGLSVGGEKKKTLYDQVYPNVMRKLVKKMGGVVKRETVGESNPFDDAKVVRVKVKKSDWSAGPIDHPISVEDSSQPPLVYAIELPDGTLLRERDGHSQDYPEDAFWGEANNPYVNTQKQQAEAHLRNLQKQQPFEAWTVTIPRGWKKKIKEGLPLFSVPAAGLLGSQSADDGG